MLYGKSPIAVEVMAVIVEAAAAIAMPITGIGNSQHAVHRAHRASDAGSNRPANDSTHRTRYTAAFARASSTVVDSWSERIPAEA